MMYQDSCAQFSSNLFSSNLLSSNFFRPIHFVQSYQVRLGFGQVRIGRKQEDEKWVCTKTRVKKFLQQFLTLCYSSKVASVVPATLATPDSCVPDPMLPNHCAPSHCTVCDYVLHTVLHTVKIQLIFYNLIFKK